MCLIDLSGLEKAAALAALYNSARAQGMGFLHYDPKTMTIEEAQLLLNGGETYFDYLNGRVLKVSLKGDMLNPGLYDRDNGPGAAKRAIQGIHHDAVDGAIPSG